MFLANDLAKWLCAACDFILNDVFLSQETAEELSPMWAIVMYWPVLWARAKAIVCFAARNSSRFMWKIPCRLCEI